MSTTDRPFSELNVEKWVLPAVLVVTFLAFANSIAGEFVYDDGLYLVNDPTIKDWSWKNLQFIFTHDVYNFLTPGMDAGRLESQFYRPVYRIFIKAAYLIAGRNPATWHIIAILLHLTAVGLAYGLLEKTTSFFPALAAKKPWIAGAGALVFAIHPVQSESVAWITGTSPTLGSIFLFLALYLYLEYQVRESHPIRWLIFSFIIFIIGLFTRENVILLPVLAAGYGFLVFHRQEALWPRTRRVVFAVLPFAGLALAYLAVRVAVFGPISLANPMIRDLFIENNQENLSLTWTDGLLTLPSVLLSYVKMMLWPYPIAPFHNPCYVRTPTLIGFWLPLGAVGALLATLVAISRRIEMAGVGLLWFLVPLLPAFSINFLPSDQIIQSRMLSIPVLGFSILAVVTVEHVLRHQPALKIPLLGTAAACVLALGVFTFLQNRLYHDNLSLFNQAAAMAPLAKSPRMCLGACYDQLFDQLKSAGAPEEQCRTVQQQAAENYRQALALSPNTMQAINRLAFIDWNLGNRQEATQLFERMVQLKPDRALSHANLGFVYQAQNRNQEAIRELELALAADPHHPQAAQWQRRLAQLKGT